MRSLKPGFSLIGRVLGKSCSSRAQSKVTTIAPISQHASRFFSAQAQSQATPSYDSPSVITSLPGPKQVELLQNLSEHQKTLEIQSFVDLKKSQGVWLVDCDGNRFLDLFQSIASVPLGYNHPSFVEVFQNPENIQWLANRTALGMFPPMDWPSQLQDSLMQIAPKHDYFSEHTSNTSSENDENNQNAFEVLCMMCGSCANENALKMAFMYHQYMRRGQEPPSEQDLTSCMSHTAPGTPQNVGVIAFEGAFHGRMGYTLSLTHSKPIHKVDCPMMSDVVVRVPFPNTKYSVDAPHNIQANMAEEDRCLNQLKIIVDQHKSQGTEIAALVIEPILSEGGDKHASIDYFRRLRKYCRDSGIIFICDEVQTGGCATGPFWNHSKWGLTPEFGGAPDMVTFAKKLQVSGVFYQKYLKPKEAYRIFNTWCGDPSKLLLCNALVRTIKEKQLDVHVQKVGNYLMQKLNLLIQENSSSRAGSSANSSEIAIGNLRGQGTFIAFDCLDPQGACDSKEASLQRERLVAGLKNEGVIVGVCGNSSVRLRPPLILGQHHCDVFLEKLESVLKLK